MRIAANDRFFRGDLSNTKYMKYTTILLITMTIGSGSLACQQAAPSNANDPVANSEAPAISSPATQPAPGANDAKPAEKVAIKADTPTDAYRTALAATKARDYESLKKVVSKDVLEFFRFMSEGDESSDDMMAEMLGSKQSETGEVRNEKINGNKATLEYVAENGEWKTMDFIKEDGMWKLTLPEGEKKGSRK